MTGTRLQQKKTKKTKTNRHSNWQTFKQKNKRIYLQKDVQALTSRHTHIDKLTKNEKTRNYVLLSLK